MNFIKQNFWQLLTTALAFVAIYATYHVFFLSKPNKALEIIVNDPVPLVEVKPEAAQDIQVLYRNEAVKKAFLLQIKILNAGNQPIAETDYSRQLSFSFSSKYKIASISTVSSQPSNIGLSLTKTSEQTAIASKTLLNPGDEVEIAFVLIGNDNDTMLPSLATDGRILGIPDIQQKKPENEDIASLWWMTIAFFISTILGLINSVILRFKKKYVN